MNSIIKYSGIAALVILLVVGFVNFTHKANPNGLAGSTACSGITCLGGGLRLVSDYGGDFESDVAALFGSTVGITGRASFAGALAASSTLQVTGATRLYSTLDVDATTTLKDTVNFDNAALCINFYATSTATRLHLVASTTAVLPAGAGALMTADYGVCTN